jgi:cell shape-determining protein MreC
MVASRRHSSLPRKTLTVLIVLSIAALLFPQAWTHRLISLVQVLVPFEHVAASAADAVEGALTRSGGTVPAEELDALRLEKEAADHRVAVLSFRVESLEREVALLTATRLWDASGQIGARGRLIPGRVVTNDLLPWRSSRLLTAGTVQGVERGAPVLSNHFTLDRGQQHGVRDGMAILLAESFVGVIVQTGTHTSRVQLLSDPATQMKVRLGRFEEDSFRVIDGYYWLVGRGGGRIQIREVSEKAVSDGQIRPGDVVLSDPTNSALPSAMMIGTVVDMVPDPSEPLFVHLNVRPAVAPDSLDRVYVFDPAAADAQRSD